MWLNSCDSYFFSLSRIIGNAIYKCSDYNRRNPRTKAELVKDITDSLVRVLGKKPEHTHVVIQEIADENWGYSGLLTDEWKQQQDQVNN